MPLPNQPRQREIRVFVSSTFRDMQEEREELVKQIFPQLRRLCESRSVAWGEVDLRWGVPDEAKAEGKVLPLCLAEIEHCRPYFIGLLGERYGWVPEEIPEDILAAQPWLNEHRKQSVTALEILHGVLRNPEMAEHAFFYFRDPEYAGARAGFTEEDPARREQLAALKENIRKSGFSVAEDFATPQQLGEWVLRDLTAVIENLYPESSIPDPLDRAAADHEAYAASRRSVYIARQEYLDRLDAHADDDGPPLVVLGESGCGKSALLANWSHAWSKAHPETPVIVHFIGASPDSADWMAVLRRLLGEFQRRFGIQAELPNEPDALRMAFANALHMVRGRGRLVLVLDALNQIEDRDGAPSLVWLPSRLPANVRLVISTLPGRPLDSLRKRGWPTLELKALDNKGRTELILRYLAQYGKRPSIEQLRRIADVRQTANALYLTTLLNELRLFGSHEELNRRIDWYLAAASPLELFRKVLERWEQDYGRPLPAGGNVVRESLSRLWAARRGLSESELLESLGREDLPLPHAEWSPLYLAAGDALINRGGLLTFSHQYLRDSVEAAYLPTGDLRRGVHAKLAALFAAKPAITERKVDEQAWQCWRGEAWTLLQDSLTDLDLFVAMRERGDSTINYWHALPDADPTYSYLNRWTERVKRSGRSSSALAIANHLGDFFGQYHQLLSAEPVLREAVALADELVTSSHRDVPLDRAVLDAYLGLGRFLRDTRRIEGAEGAFRKALCVAEQFFSSDQTSIAAILSDLGWLLSLTGRGAEAEEAIQRSVRVWDESGHDLSLGLAKTLMVLGIMKHKQDRLAEGEAALSRALSITEQILGPNDPNVAPCLSNLGGVLHALRRYSAAEAAFSRAVKVLEESGYGDSIQMAVALNNLAQLLLDMGRVEAAEPISRKQLELLARWSMKAGSDHMYLASSATNYGVVLERMGLNPQAVERRLQRILYSPELLIQKGKVL